MYYQPELCKHAIISISVTAEKFSNEFQYAGRFEPIEESQNRGANVRETEETITRWLKKHVVCFMLWIPQKTNNRFIVISNWHANMICYCKGGIQNEICPVAIADLVLMYNVAQEGLYGPSKNDRCAFDLFALCPGTKTGFVKFCKAHEQRVCPLLPYCRVIRADYV